MKLPISDIKIGAGRREARSEEVRKLADSIAEVGLLNPVTVDQSHTLIAGRHRLEAVRLLGWTEIECTVCGLEGIAAEIAEIDENFVRTNASAIEIGEMLKRRKQLYETLHPETKAGVAQANGMNRALGNNVDCTVQSTSKSFVEDTAGKWGVHPSTVSRHLQIAEGLTTEAKDILCSMKQLPRQTVLRQLSALEPEDQEAVATLLASGEIKTVGEYRERKDTAATDELNDEAKSAAELSEVHTDAVMTMAVVTDDFLAGVRAFLKYEDAVQSLPFEWLRKMLEMLDAIDKANDYLLALFVEAHINGIKGGSNAGETEP